MSSLRAWCLRFGGLFNKERRDCDLSEELESHLQMHIEDNLRSGMKPEQARREALIKLGGVEATKEHYRHRRGLPFLETVLQDIRFGLRILRKNPGFTLVAVLTLALGIGANTAIFSVVNAVLLKSLPYKDPEELVFVRSTMISQGLPSINSAAPDFREWRNRNRVFSDIGAFTYHYFNLSGTGGEPARLRGVMAAPSLLSLLGVDPILGRTFLAEEEQWGRNRVVVLSYGLWQTKFGGDKSVLGRAVNLDGQNYVIVGVASGKTPFVITPVDFWVPLAYAPNDQMNTRGNHYLDVVARLRPDTSIQQAQAEMSGIAAQLEKEFPADKGIGIKVVPMREEFVGGVRSALLILLGAVAFVLLIACVNVANLMLARASAREQEFAVRSALGASRSRLLRQLLLEGILTALFGGVGGVIIATCGMKFFESILPSDLPRLNPIGISTGVLLFTVAISVLTSVLFSLVPAIHASKADIQEHLCAGGRGGDSGPSRQRMRSLLITLEVALALPLLIGAALLIRTFTALRHVDPGFSTNHVLTLRILLSRVEFPIDHDNQTAQLFQDIVTRVDALPGVKGSGLTDVLPMGFYGYRSKYVDVPGRMLPTSIDKVPIVRFQFGSAGYMPAIGAQLRSGRFFTEQDDQQATAVAIINEAFVHQFFPNEDPINKSIRMLPPLNLLPLEFRAKAQEVPFRTIVGVIADMKDTAMNQPALPAVYAPYLQRGEGWSPAMTLVVRTTGNPLSLVAAVRDQIHSLLPDQSLGDILAIDQLLASGLSQARFSMLLLTTFAGLALILFAIGMYGVMAYAVARQTHQIGIRIALGAQRNIVLRTVINSGMKLVLVGGVIGSAAALVLTRLLSSQLFEVKPTDPLTFVGVAALLSIVALLACYIPARRATRVDPLVALRHE